MSFVVYKASAGSGKTYTLVKEYLKLGLNSPEAFRSVLAITFTNKAANEMKNRVIKYLKEISKYKENLNNPTIKHLLPQLALNLGLSEEQTAENAFFMLKSILHNYSDFAISTIDSFVYKIIRSFAFDLQLSQDFEVEMDTEEMMTGIVDILINGVGSDKSLTRTLVNFVKTKIAGDKSWHIEKDLLSMAKKLTEEETLGYSAKLKALSADDFENSIRIIRSRITSFEKDVREEALKAVRVIEQAGVQDSAFSYGTTGGIPVYFKSLANGKYDYIVPKTRVLNTIENDKWFSSKATAEEKRAIENIIPVLKDIFLKLEKTGKERYKEYVLLKEIWSNIYPLAVLSAIEKIFETYKRENGIIHISEFNKIISDIISGEPAPFIYERAGTKYGSFLIDEFQDTSVLQWHNMLPLIEESLSRSGFNMIVGDGKQAIYRWRSGEVEQFARLPEIYKKPDNELFKQREELLKRNYKAEVLRSNYRSKAEIVSFNNDFFSVLSGFINEKYRNIYDDVIQEFDEENTGGYVQIEFLDKDDITDIATQNTKRILQLVDELVDDGFELKDIAILCRSNNEASMAAKELLLNGYEVVSSESLLLKNSEKAGFLINLMTWMTDNNNKIAKAAILRFLSGESDLHRLLSVINNDEKTDRDLFDTGKSFTDIVNEAGLNINSLSGLPLYEMVEEVIRVIEKGGKQDIYLRFFLNIVHEFVSKNETGIDGFLRWWEKKKNQLSIVVPEGINAIKVMTIHKSKGLEFPVVIYPFANSKLKSTKGDLWLDLKEHKAGALDVALIKTKKTLESTAFSEVYNEEMQKSFLDMINLLYVTFTRAEHRLYVISSQPPSPKGNPDTIPKLIRAYLEEKGLWEEDKSIYSSGNKSKKQITTAQEFTEIFEITWPESTLWKTRIKQKTVMPDYWKDRDQGAMKYGEIVHNVLSRIKTAGDAEQVLSALESDGAVSLQESLKVKKAVVNLLNDPVAGKYFAQGLNVKTEVEILLEDGKVVRPDRIIISGKQATVIDFKTGKPNDRHRKQITFYMEKITELGFEKTEGVLLYIDDNGLSQIINIS